MNSNNIFIDTNILIGAAVGRVEDRACLHYLYSLEGKNLFISALSIAQLVATIQKKISTAELKQIVKEYLHRFQIVAFTEADIIEALERSETDLEDNIQYVIGTKVKCKYFITNNLKDFRRYLAISVKAPKDVRSIKR
ncbi:MAG: PIN domain-containing protein [Bacteroidales bacterium]|nr:PIN domain-containing protein [Bacteroidales bacterium]